MGLVVRVSHKCDEPGSILHFQKYRGPTLPRWVASRGPSVHRHLAQKGPSPGLTLHCCHPEILKLCARGPGIFFCTTPCNSLSHSCSQAQQKLQQLDRWSNRCRQTHLLLRCHLPRLASVLPGACTASCPLSFFLVNPQGAPCHNVPAQVFLKGYCVAGDREEAAASLISFPPSLSLSLCLMWTVAVTALGTVQAWEQFFIPLSFPFLPAGSCGYPRHLLPGTVCFRTGCFPVIT